MIVIGSGATGGVAALTFAEKGIRVLVLEAGPQFSAREAMGSKACNMARRMKGIATGEQRLQAQHPGYWKANPMLYANEKQYPYTYPTNQPFIWTQGRQVGGKSLTWGGITLRLSDHEFKASIEDGYGPEWPIMHKDLDEHYSALEKKLKIHGQKDGLSSLPDGHYIAPLPLTSIESQFAKKIERELGFPVIHSRGFGPHNPSSGNDWPRSSSPGSTLEKALATGKVEIVSNQMVERIILKGDQTRATGVVIVDQLNGQRQEIGGELIVLCASTIASLRILLSSEESIQEKGFINTSGDLGCSLMDHISTCRFFTMSSENNKTIDEVDFSLSGAGSFLIPIGEKLRGSNDKKFLRNYGLWGAINRFEPPQIIKGFPNTKTGFLIGHGEVLSNKENKVTLSSKLDQWGIPVPNIQCKWRENENLMASHIQKTIDQIIKTAGGEVLPLKEIINFPLINPILDKAVALKDAPPPPGYYIHEVGGARMGTKESSSVVDQWNRIWRCQNVLVVDGACWPTSGWQSPTLTMMAITRRACLKAIRNQSD